MNNAASGADDLVGVRFGRLVARERTDKPDGISAKNRGAWWLCDCDCGNTHIAMAYNLKRGNVRSCGCIKNLHKQRAGQARAEQLKQQNCSNFKTQGSSNAVKHGHALAIDVKCPGCKKIFGVTDKRWAYRRRGKTGKIEYCCSWKCYRATEPAQRPHGNSMAAKALG